MNDEDVDGHTPLHYGEEIFAAETVVVLTTCTRHVHQLCVLFGSSFYPCSV